jgi:hypothetical protein
LIERCEKPREIERCEPARMMWDACMDDQRAQARGLCTADEHGPGYGVDNRPIKPGQFDTCVVGWATSPFAVDLCCRWAQDNLARCASTDAGAAQ